MASSQHTSNDLQDVPSFERAYAVPCGGADAGVTVEDVVVSRHFEVHEGKLAGLVKTIEALARRARRLGVEGPRVVVGETFLRPVKDERTDEVRYYPMVHVDVSGVSPKIAGWEFGATVDHDGEENIVRAIKDGFPAAYRSAGPVCEHCNVRRRRNETFLLRHEGGTWKQVGRSCLKDFLGHESPGHYAAMAEYLAEALASAEDGGELGGSGGRYESSIESYLAFVACAVRVEGWLSRSAAQEFGPMPTASLAAMWMSKPPPGESYPRPIDEDRAVVEEALAWARSISDDASEFDRNLRAASKRVSVAYKNMGITAYIVPGFLKEKVRRQKRAQRGESKWVGEVGVRFGAGKGKKAVPALKLLCERVIPIEDAFGTTHLHIFSDDGGNNVKWFSSRECLETGKTYSVVGTVKEHGEYKGVKETVLSRCDARELDEDGNFFAELTCVTCRHSTKKQSLVPGEAHPCPNGHGEMVPTWG